MGILYAVLSCIMNFVQGPNLRKELQKFSENKLVIIGSLVLGINFIFFLSNNILLIYTAAILFAIGNGLMWPSLLSILAKKAGTVHQGAVQGVASSFASLASIIGLTIGGGLYSEFRATTFLIRAEEVFTGLILSSLMLII